MSFVTNSDFYLYIFATQCSRPLIFEIKNPVRSNNQKFSTLGCKDIEIKIRVYVKVSIHLSFYSRRRIYQ